MTHKIFDWKHEAEQGRPVAPQAYLDLAEDCANLREANRDWADTAAMYLDDLRIERSRRKEAEQVRDFALATADMLLAQADRNDKRFLDTERALKQERQTTAILEQLVENLTDELEAEHARR